jgi:transposase
LLYDLTSTYFEGEVQEVDKARYGHSRDQRPECKQLVLALVVTPEGFPLSYEVFEGNRADVTTLEEMLDAVERKHGRARRVWIFDRGIVSEDNLQRLRERGASYLVGTPRAQLKVHERRLLEGDWQSITDEVQVQLIVEDNNETYVLARSRSRAQKESAIRSRVVRGLMRDLIRLRRLLRHGRLKDPAKVLVHLGRLKERYQQAWRYVKIELQELRLSWQWDRQALRLATSRDGAYLLRTNLEGSDPAELWTQYIQLTEVEAVFRALKSDLAISSTGLCRSNLLPKFTRQIFKMCGQPEPLFPGAPEEGAAQIREKCESRASGGICHRLLRKSLRLAADWKVWTPRFAFKRRFPSLSPSPRGYLTCPSFPQESAI